MLPKLSLGSQFGGTWPCKGKQPLLLQHTTVGSSATRARCSGQGEHAPGLHLRTRLASPAVSAAGLGAVLASTLAGMGAPVPFLPLLRGQSSAPVGTSTWWSAARSSRAARLLAQGQLSHQSGLQR